MADSSDKTGASDKRRDRAMPDSMLARTAKLAALPVGFAGRTTLGVGRRIVGAPADAVLLDVQRRTAEQVFAVLGQLKGGAMKFGQAMSVFEAALPEDVIGPYRDTLTKLQDSAPPMPAAVVHRVMAQEHGDDWREHFVSFNDKPAAAASIGQVHRATWREHIDDEPVDVAVKLQYPGAAKALRSDLRQVSRMARMLGVMAPNIDVAAIVRELQDRVEEELDYSLEAGAQSVFAMEFEGDPHIVVPTPLAYTERSLVSTWMESDYSLAEVIRDGSQAERDRLGEMYVRFLFAGPARTGMLHADPHPGNFRVLADGRLGVVDYGAVARLPEGLPINVGRALRAAVDEDYELVVELMREEGFIKPGVKLSAETIGKYLGPFVDPARTETFHFTREWMRAEVARISAPTVESMGTALKINLPPEYLLIHRVWVGGVGVLSQLGATAPFRQILAESLPGFADES